MLLSSFVENERTSYSKVWHSCNRQLAPQRSRWDTVSLVLHWTQSRLYSGLALSLWARPHGPKRYSASHGRVSRLRTVIASLSYIMLALKGGPQFQMEYPPLPAKIQLHHCTRTLRAIHHRHLIQITPDIRAALATNAMRFDAGWDLSIAWFRKVLEYIRISLGFWYARECIIWPMY